MGKRVRKLTRRNKIMRKSLRRNSKISRKSIRRKSKISRRNKSIKKRRVNRKTLRRYKLRGGAHAAVAEASKSGAPALTDDNVDSVNKSLFYTLTQEKYPNANPNVISNMFYKKYEHMLFICKELEAEDNFNVIVANIIVNNPGISEGELINKIYTSFGRTPPIKNA